MLRDKEKRWILCASFTMVNASVQTIRLKEYAFLDSRTN